MKPRLFLQVFITSLLLIQNASAKEYEQDPFNDADFAIKPTLLDKAHPTQKRLELGLDFTTSMVSKYAKHKGFVGTIGYHFHDSFALELYGGIMVGKHDPIMATVQNKINANGGGRNPNFPDLQMMTWIADAVFLWTPIYGKINLVSELAISGNIYFLLGAGANGARHIEYTGEKVSDGVKFNFQWGAGGRIYLTSWMAIRMEYRDIDYFGKWKSNNDKTKKTPDYTYLTMNHMFHIGLSFFPF